MSVEHSFAIISSCRGELLQAVLIVDVAVVNTHPPLPGHVPRRVGVVPVSCQVGHLLIVVSTPAGPLKSDISVKSTACLYAIVHSKSLTNLIKLRNTTTHVFLNT